MEMDSSGIESRYSTELFAEQVRLLYKNAPLAYIATLMNGAILAFVQSAHISVPVVLAWYGSLVLVTAIRALIVRQYARIQPGCDEAPRWNTIYVSGALSAGTVWGSAALVLFPVDSIAHQVLVAFVLAGMSAGGISVLAPRMEACLAFLLPALLPLAVQYLRFGTTLQTAMGIMTLLFLAGMLTSAWTFHCAIRTSFHLRFDKRELEAEVEQRRRAEEELFREKERLQTTLASIGEGVALVDAEGRIEYMNPAAEQLVGWSFHDALNRPVREIFRNVDADHHSVSTAMEDSLYATDRVTKQSILFCKAGKEHVIEELATPLYDRHSNLIGVVSVLRDVTEATQRTEQLAHAVDHDPLTGLPNRNLLKDRTRQAIARAQRKHENFALLFLDLDRFKAVNDSMGHAAGDALLVDVAKRLTDCVREEDTIARLGGDEFVVLLDGPTQEMQVKAVADKIRRTLRKPYQVGAQSATVTVSIGASLYPFDGRDPESLLGHADSAMYHAKQQGRDRVCI
jgi:diguanylate cyclase (GGDEF)-like protein/PAS domain S-box-containing protein